MTAAAFPSFAGVAHPSFQWQWLLEGLDRLFSADARISQVNFDLWASYYYDDNDNVDLKGTANFVFDEGRMSEEDLDEIPAVRMLERRAAELWHTVPMVPSTEDGSINGSYSFHARRGLILFEYTSFNGEDEPVMSMEARHDGEKWVARETLTIGRGGAALTDIATLDHQAVLDQSFDASANGLEGQPRAIGMEVVDDDTLTFLLEPGQLVENTTQI